MSEIAKLVERLTEYAKPGRYHQFDEEKGGFFWQDRFLHPICAEAAASLTHQTEKVALLEQELAWYGEQARLARLIHSEGDKGRNALAADGGRRARSALDEGRAPSVPGAALDQT